jgi:hypothetical protein
MLLNDDRLPAVRYAIAVADGKPFEPQTLGLLGCFVPKGYANADFNPNYAGEISLAKLFHFDTYECAPTGLS